MPLAFDLRIADLARYHFRYPKSSATIGHSPALCFIPQRRDRLERAKLLQLAIRRLNRNPFRFKPQHLFNAEAQQSIRFRPVFPTSYMKKSGRSLLILRLTTTNEYMMQDKFYRRRRDSFQMRLS